MRSRRGPQHQNLGVEEHIPGRPANSVREVPLVRSASVAGLSGVGSRGGAAGGPWGGFGQGRGAGRSGGGGQGRGSGQGFGRGSGGQGRGISKPGFGYGPR